MPSPEFLIDRSLGRNKVPQALRAHGMVVHTLFSVYGNREQHIDDPQWVAIAGIRGWFVLTADKRIRYDVSTALLTEHQVGVFQLSRSGGSSYTYQSFLLLVALHARSFVPSTLTISSESGRLEPLLAELPSDRKTA